ncbi:ATP-binding protein [Planktomarina temperata]|nr:ATP-binding protein [Planktomarina temperata]
MSNFTLQSTNEMVFHSDVERDLLLDILNHNIKFPSNGKNSLLLYGVVGSGKTTYANIFFSEYEHSFKDSSLLLDSMRVNDIEVDGNEKITTTVDKINTVANFVPLNRSNKHFFLFDEVDNYSLEQQKRLKSCLNREDIVCVMTTNHIVKIDKGLQSRSHIICFNATHNTKNYVDRMKQIIRQNSLPMLKDKTLVNIASNNNGDWRSMCSTLQQACSKFIPPTKPKLQLVSSK